MRRAPIVITATVAGLVGVLEFHTSPSAVSIGAIPAAGTTAAPASSGPASPAPPRPGSTRQPSGASATRPAAAPSATAPSAGSRTAVGPPVSYGYGVLSVSVTVSGRKITKVGIASINDGGNPRSQFIDQQSIPMLEQQALQAQSASIQGVSGASYTSAGFHQSLQAALQQLGVG